MTKQTQKAVVPMTASPESQQLGTEPDLAVHNEGIASSEPSEPPVPLDTARLAWSRSYCIFAGIVGRKWLPM